MGDALTANHQLDEMMAKALAYREVLRGTRGKLDIARRQRDEALSLYHETMAEVERLREDDSRARAALKQIIEISAGPIRRIAEEGLA